MSAHRLRMALATKNPGKVREIATIIGDAIDVIGPDPAWTPPAEDRPDYAGNALLKARSLVGVMGIGVLADDSGIEVDALDGAPGPRSARYAGDGATDAQNLAKLIAAVRRTPAGARGARYRCAAVAVFPDGREVVVEETVEDSLIEEPRGSGGFGYDPIFVPSEFPDQTMAELSAASKDSISHRGKAFRALMRAVEDGGGIP